MYNSVYYTLVFKIESYMEEQDAKGMWESLATLDRSNDLVYTGMLKEQFNAETLGTNESIQNYHGRLDFYRTQLMDTEFKLSDSDIRTKILFSLPDTPEWTQARQFIYHENQDLLTAIATLQRYEKPKLATATANKTTDSRKDKSNGRQGNARGRGHGSYRGRGRGRGGRRGGYHGIRDSS